MLHTDVLPYVLPPWQRTAERAKDVLAPAARVTVVADREADIYAHWDAVPASGFDLLTRANNDRRLAGGGMLFVAAAQFALADTRTIDVRARAPGQPRPRATIAVRFGEVETARPRDPHHHRFAATVRLRMIGVREIAPPQGGEPLHWRLLTTHEIADAAKAWQIVGSGASHQTCRDGRKGRLRRHATGAGARWQTRIGGCDRTFALGRSTGRPWNAVEAECLVEILVWDLAELNASLVPSAASRPRTRRERQPSTQLDLLDLSVASP